MKNTNLRSEIHELARAVLKERWCEREVRLHVEALLGSLDDTLSDEHVLDELRGLKAGGPMFGKIIADNLNN